MANLFKIKEIAEQKKISIKDLSSAAGITTQAFHKLIRENSTRVDTLELISRKLGVSIAVFFDEDIPSSDVEQSESLIKLIDNNALLAQTNAKLTETNTKLTDRILELTEDSKKSIAGSA